MAANNDGGMRDLGSMGATIADPEDDPATFLKQNGAFQIKIRVNGGPDVRKAFLREFDNLSFEELMKQVEHYTAQDNVAGEKSLSYIDSDGDQAVIRTTSDFLFALKESVSIGYLKINASQIGVASISPPPPSPPPPPPPPPVAIQECVEDVPMMMTTPTKKTTGGGKRKAAVSASGDGKSTKRTKMTGTSLSMVCAPSTSHVGPFKAGSIYAKIVYSVLELQALGFEQPSKTQVALLSGYTNPETAAFRNALSIVRTKSGFVDYLSKKRVKLTDIAIQTLAPATPPPNNAAVHRRLCGVISKGKKCGPKIQQIFMMLTDGLEHAKKEVAAANGYTNTETSAFRNSLAKLGGLGLLEYPTMGANGTVQLTDLCFPYGRSGEEASSGPPPPPAVAAPAPVHVTPTSSPSISQRSSSRARKPSQRLLAAIEGNENIAPASVMVTPDEALSNIDEAILNIDPVSVDVSPDEAHTNNDEEMVNIAVAPTPDETSFDIAEGTPATSMRSAHNAISSAATVTPTPTSSNEAVFNGMATVAPGPVERRILCTLAELRALKVLPVPLMTLVLLVGYQNATSTGFQKAMSKLKGGGHVCKLSGSANMIDIAESGLELIPKVQPPQTNELVHKRLCALLGKKKGSSAKKTSEMFMLLAEGEAKTRHELMKAMGYKNLTSTGFSVAMSELKKYGLIAASGSGANGSVWLTDTCFPHGRP